MTPDYWRKCIKYHSLGNDFLIFEAPVDGVLQHEFHSPSWPSFVRGICDRHYGIGADGVIVVSRMSIPEIYIFNSDGSRASNCLNGTRCVAHFVYSNKLMNNHFSLRVGNRIAECAVDEDTVIIRTLAGTYLKRMHIDTKVGCFIGHNIYVGNPHFVIENKVEPTWLQSHGHEIESYDAFPDRTNVEFFWPEEDGYTILVYERGAGLTLACGTGAAAVTTLLMQSNRITMNTWTKMRMLGGIVSVLVENNDYITLRATAMPICICELHNNLFL